VLPTWCDVWQEPRTFPAGGWTGVAALPPSRLFPRRRHLHRIEAVSNNVKCSLSPSAHPARSHALHGAVARLYAGRIILLYLPGGRASVEGRHQRSHFWRDHNIFGGTPVAQAAFAGGAFLEGASFVAATPASWAPRVLSTWPPTPGCRTVRYLSTRSYQNGILVMASDRLIIFAVTGGSVSDARVLYS